MKFPNVSCNTHNVCIQASYDKFLCSCDKCSKTWTTVCLTSKRKERCIHMLHIIHIRYHQCIRQFVLSPTVPTSGSYIITTNEGTSIWRNSQSNVLYYKTWNVFTAKSFEVILCASNKITKLTREYQWLEETDKTRFRCNPASYGYANPMADPEESSQRIRVSFTRNKIICRLGNVINWISIV